MRHSKSSPPPHPISTPLLIFDCQPPSWYKFLSLPSLPLPLKSKMAAIIFVKKILSTPRQNYASSAGQLISRSQVLSLVTMLIISLFFCVCLHVSPMETCLCDWLIACHYQPCCTPKDENPQVNHTRAVKEYDRSAADKVKGIFHSSFRSSVCCANALCREVSLTRNNWLLSCCVIHPLTHRSD